MKRIFLALALVFIAAPAQADEPVGGWVIVDSDGKQVGGVIVCTPSVCGDPNSAVSKDLLKAGQRFVQQTLADNNGNVAGIPATADTQISVTPNNTFVLEQKTPVIVESTSAKVTATKVTTTEFTLADTANGQINQTTTKVAIQGSVKVEPVAPVATTETTEVTQAPDYWLDILLALQINWEEFLFNLEMWSLL